MLDTIHEVNTILAANDIELGARVGISFGAVTVAPDPSGHLTATGDEVNIASRMESTAEVDTVQVTHRVQQFCENLFTWQALGEINVKGKQSPLHTFRPTGPGVEQRARWERAARVADSPLVGRDYELSQLSRWLHGQTREISRNRRGGAKHIMIGVKGDAGVGKSRLVHEFIRRETNRDKSLHVLRGQTLSYAQPAFWLWITLLRDYFGIAAAGDDSQETFRQGWKRMLDTAIDADEERMLTNSESFIATLLSMPGRDARIDALGEHARRQETLIALKVVLHLAASTAERLLLVFEDLQWIDPASTEALEFVLANCDTELPIAIICMYRPESESTVPTLSDRLEGYVRALEIRLAGLNDAGCKQHIRHLLGDSRSDAGAAMNLAEENDVDSDIVSFLLENAQGNPFFLEELTLDLIESGNLYLDQNRWKLKGNKGDIVVPSSLASLVRSRIDRLPGEQKQGLQERLPSQRKPVTAIGRRIFYAPWSGYAPNNEFKVHALAWVR